MAFLGPNADLIGRPGSRAALCTPALLLDLAALERNLMAMAAFCDRHGLYLFEDNCESMGATLDGKPCGTFGDLNTFSTFYSHHISTMEGGLLVTNRAELANLARAIRNHGWARDCARKTSPDPPLPSLSTTSKRPKVRPIKEVDGVGEGSAAGSLPTGSITVDESSVSPTSVSVNVIRR